MNYNYTIENFKEALIKAEIYDGDTIFIHSNIGAFGLLKDAYNITDYCKSLLDAVISIIGSNGTVVVPTFSYSFFNKTIFDLKNTKSVCGAFSEYIRMLPNSHRNIDPNFSVTAIGKKAKEYTKGIIFNSFDQGSFFDRFLNNNGKICNFNLDSASTYIHYVEKSINVPYRFDLGFNGTILYNNTELRCRFYHYASPIDTNKYRPDFTKFDSYVKNNNISKVSNVGKGQIVSISAEDTYNVIKEQLKVDGNFLING